LKRLIVIVLLMGALTVLTACAPKPEEVNAVVNNFWDQWKVGNEAGMVDLMTDEVDYGILISDDALSTALSTALPTTLSIPPTTKGVPAESIAPALISSELQNLGTLTISSTEAFGDYAIVTCQFTATADPTISLQFIFHLNDTDAGWKINFLGIKGLA